MLIKRVPDTFQKLTQMGDATLYEPAGDSPQTEARRGRYQARSLEDCISHVSTPRGKKPILKTMITTACEKNCFYCPFRAGRGKTTRVTVTPDELAKGFDAMQHSRMVDGLFLSSGIIKGGVVTQDKIIDTVEILRRRHQYRGYIHLKIMPGAEYDQIARAMTLADRVSINLEGPTQERLSALAPKKDFSGELLERLRWAYDLRTRLQQAGRRSASIVTQFVVGAVGDSDLELLALSERLYTQMGLARAYYSAFNPVEQTPFEDRAPVSPQREFRLYQASFLLRDYQWDVEDLSFAQDGNLRLDVDPKRAWAEVNLRQQPVDVMTATREQLLRVPGFGPRGADAILHARQLGALTDLAHLRKIGIRAPEQSAPFILLNGRSAPQQLQLL